MAAQAFEDISLTSLAESISSNMKIITDILNDQKLPHPTLSASGPLHYTGGPDDARLQEARTKLLTSAWTLEQLASGPQNYIYWQAYTTKHDLTVLSVFAKFGVFEAVPTTGDISYSDLAAKLPMTERQVRRLFRHAMTKNIFFEPRPDYVAHTALSIAPVRKRSLTPWINHNLGDVLPASSRLGDAMEKYGDSQDPTETAISIAWNLETGKGLFDWFKGDGEGSEKGWRARQFARAMESMAGGGHETEYTADGFDWKSLGAATVVDVGGSSGHISIFLAEKFPALRLVVQDLPEVETAFEALVPSNLRSRVSYQAHNFTRPQPQQSADVFLLRHVLHDWPDAVAVEILRNIINSREGLIKDGARLIVVDNVMQPRDALPVPVERLITTADLQMWTALNALERSKEDWIDLFRQADKRLDPVAFVQPAGSSETVIEIVFRHE
ncbi:putative O-methyltransferase [Cladophialophora carrionii]|uniref:Putative O-methyltransferase n=1 Tax=Cladophialophora carrionii TaxID=86049 RepID=A0A1C1CXV5_9EURO|nr:putative O-methyltransferase [Cladophialophora carrionii]